MIKDLKKILGQLGLLGIISFSFMNTGVVMAAEATPTEQSAPSGDDSKLAKLLTSLGHFLGYAIDNPSEVPAPNNSLLEKASSTQTSLEDAITFFLGTTISKTIVDPDNKLSSLNDKTNAIFKETYSKPNTGSGANTTLTVNPLIDEPPYQTDPIRQSILNLTTTPDITNCTKINCSSPGAGQEELAIKCCPDKNSKSRPLVFRGQVSTNVIGTLPTADLMYHPLSSSVIDQLDMNSFLEPKLYTTTEKSTTSSTPEGATSTAGLSANNQAQSAENYIRYVTGSVTPPEQTDYQTYSHYYQQATKLASTAPKDLVKNIEDMGKAQATLSKFITEWRSYSAQKSVGVANLYHILSKRMPQKGKSETTSEALIEFQMATKRLYNPDADKDNQWINNINKASPATIQKEIALLLAEINYQLYLNRQEQERLLLTNSVMLVQLGRLVSPPALPPINQ